MKDQKEKILNAFSNKGFSFGRMVGPSKSTYLKQFPDNLVIFNARIYDKETFKKEKDKKIKDFFAGQEIEIWYGDLDLSNDIKALYDLVGKLGLDLFITTETGEAIIEIKCPSWMKGWAEELQN